MSIKIMQLVWETQLPASKKLVLLALADNANDEGDCFPSISTIARKCGLSERAVQYAITELDTDGHVSRKERSGRSTIYCVHPRNTCTPATDAPVQMVHPGVQMVHPTPAIRAPHPRNTCTHNHQVTIKGTITQPSTGLDASAWSRWETYRREIKRPLKQASIPAAQKKLAAFGADQSSVVEQSIANGWQGLFPLKDESKKSNEAQLRRVIP